MRIDESVTPPLVYVCGSYRSQTYAPLLQLFHAQMRLCLSLASTAASHCAPLAATPSPSPPSTSTTTAAASCTTQPLTSQPLSSIKHHRVRYTTQMDTCMGMGFIDTGDSHDVPKVTRIDPTAGPRAGSSHIVVAGSGRTPRARAQFNKICTRAPHTIAPSPPCSRLPQHHNPRMSLRRQRRHCCGCYLPPARGCHVHVTAVACSGSSCVSGGGGWVGCVVCGACGWVAVLGSCGCEEIEVWVHRVACVIRDA